MSDRQQLEAGLQRQLDALGDRAPAGWKVGLTSGAARDSMGEGFRPFGHILPDRVFDSGARIPLAGPANTRHRERTLLSARPGAGGPSEPPPSA